MYTLYAWIADDEGGYGICLTKEFSPYKTDYYPESGWRARPSVKLGEFDTAEQLVKLFNREKCLSEYPLTMEEATQWIITVQRKIND